MITKTVRRPIVAMFILFALALIPRVVFYHTSGPYGMVHIKSSQKVYLDLAATLWSSGQFSQSENGAPHGVVGPGYPIFLAPFVGAFGYPPRESLHFQIVLGGISACLCYCLARRLSGNIAGWMAGLLAIAYVRPSVHASMFYTEALAIPLFLVGMLLIDLLLDEQAKRWRLVFGVSSGAVFALLALTRFVHFPLIAVPLLFAVAAGWRQPKRVLAVAASIVLGFCLVYSPWVVRNHLAFDEFVLLRHCDESFLRQQQEGYEILEKYGVYDRGRQVLQQQEQERARTGVSKSLPKFDPLIYLRHTMLRLRIMLGLYPRPGEFDNNPLARWWDMLWGFVTQFFALLAACWAVKRADIRVLQTVAVPYALIGCYAITHALPRYQIVPYSGLVIPAGIGMAIVLRWIVGRATAPRTGISIEKTPDAVNSEPPL